MQIHRDSKNRLVIFFFYDGMGKVDSYIPYMLNDIMKSSKDLFVVSNGKINDEGKEIFGKMTDQILERENSGFDVGAYQDALLEIGWEKLESYDEVILMNYTIMGPIYPFEEMFHVMDEKDLDFWGISKFHKVDGDPFGIIKCGYLREHIQSHFIVARQDMVKSQAFHDYWEKMPVIKSYAESVAYHESYFTHHFEKRGFTWEVYANSDDLKELTDFPLLKVPTTMVRDKRCPIIKRRSFMHDYDDFINTTVGEPSYELMEYLKNHTDYDVDMIWENILRCTNQTLIKQCLQLNYILPSNTSKDMSEVLKQKKVALIMHLYFEDLLEESYHYASSMPKEADLYITTGSERMKELIEKKFADIPCHALHVILIENRGRDVSALLVASKDFIMDYDYVCFAHDKKVAQLKPMTKGAGWSYKCYENILKSQDFVNNVIDLFEENPRLGMLTTSPPNHGDYFPTLGMEWAGNYKGVKKLAEKLGLEVPINKNLPPIAPLGSIFWFRPKAMKKMYAQDWQYTDFPEEPLKNDGSISHSIERIHSFVVQDAGYYPAWVFSDTGAKIEMTSISYMLRELNLGCIGAGIGGPFIDVRNQLVHRGPVIKSFGKLGEALEEFYPESQKKDKIDRQMHLYYDDGHGITEKSSVVCKAMIQKERFDVEFEIPQKTGAIQMFRYDPGEKGMIVIRDVLMTLQYEDGTYEVIELDQCSSNGYMFEKKILFMNEDPQIYYHFQKPVNLSSMRVSGKIDTKIKPGMMKKALHQRLPQIAPVLYYDLGTGFAEAQTMTTTNLGNSELLQAEFDVSSVMESITAFRFDPSERGMFVFSNYAITMIYEDGKEDSVSLDQCEGNGYKLGDGLFFLSEDPQIIWRTREGNKIARVQIKADIREDITSEMMMQVTAKPEPVVEQNGFFSRKLKKS